MTPEQTADVLDAERRVRELRMEYTSDSDAFSALSLIVVHLAQEVPWHVKAAFDWFNEDDDVPGPG